MRIGFAMPTYNRSALLKKRVPEYVANMDDDMALHVRDNGSTDDTWQVLESMPHERVRLDRDPVDTHVKVGFLRVLESAARDSDYVVLMSDEDVPDWNVLPVFRDWLIEHEPVFASTQFQHSGGFHRGRLGGDIGVTESFSSSFYCSGLVFRSRDLLEVIPIIFDMLADNQFLRIYAESGCVLALFNREGRRMWSPHYLCRQVDQLDTDIVMDDGSHYWRPDSRQVLYESFQAFCGALLGWSGNDVFRAAKRDSLIAGWR